jgi:flavin-binding protein dodecin
VRERDLAAAAEAVRRAREEAAAIDWDAVDLQGDPGGDGDES